jgi:hypothetical protein
MRSILVIIFMHCVYISFSQTVVIAKIYGNKIYVGADTRIGNVKKNITSNRFDTLISSGCKIYSESAFNFSPIGYAGDLQVIAAKEASSTSTDFTTLVNAYVKLFLSSLNASLIRIRSQSEQTFQEVIERNRTTISQTVFFGFEQTQPVIMLIKFKIDKVTPISFKYEILRNNSSGDSNVIAAGEVEELESMIKNDSVWRLGPTRAISEMIKLEAKLHPLHVSEVCDIVEVTDKGLTYKKRSGFCK